MSATTRESDGPSRTAVIAALVVAIGALAAVLLIAANREHAAVPISAVPAPAAESPDCAQLMAQLPDRLGDFQRAPTADPTPPGTAAWTNNSSADPVILRCGLNRPADFVVGSPLQMVDQVSWFQVHDADRSTWFAVDRPVYVALTLPRDAGSGPIQVLSATLAGTLPVQPIDPGPPR